MGDRDGKKFESHEEVRAFVNSDAFADEFKKECVTSFEKWWHENPEEVAAITAHCRWPNITSSPVAEACPIRTPLAEVLADERTNEHKRRFQAEGVAVPFDAAVRLAFCLMALRLPYGPARKGEERPADTRPYIYDYEILAANSRLDKCIPELVEASESNLVAWEALQALVKSQRQNGQPAGALLEWALDAADGTRVRPTGKRQNTYARNLLIVKTVHDLVGCGLSARRNDGAAPKSACDAVSQALKVHGVQMEYSGVETVWRRQRGAN